MTFHTYGPKGNTMKNSKFAKGSGCYKCRLCGKMTRETGECESGISLCALCYTKSGMENELRDSGIDTIDGVDVWDALNACTSMSEVYELTDRLQNKAEAE